MDMTRPIDTFLGLAAAAITARAAGTPTEPAALRLAALLDSPPEPAAPQPPARLPACDHLADATARMRPDLAAAFTALEPQLAWTARPNSDPDLTAGYAGARVLGPNGLEQRGGLVAGFSLAAPGITYPDHDHPPEEIYLVLGGGAWRQNANPWHEPGVGGLVHNPPGILHAMRGTDVPLLAIWFLLPDAPA